MGRVYEVTFSEVAVSAAQDLVGIIGASGKSCRIKRWWVCPTDTTLPTSQMFSVRARLGSATVTAGSGGSSATPRATDLGDSNASFTARINDTTKQTTSGAYTIQDSNGFHGYQGYDKTPSSPPVVGPSEGFVFELLSTPTGTVHLSGGVEVEEIGG